MRPASAFTEVLYNFGDAVSAATNAVVIPVELIVSLAFDPLLGALTAIQNPELTDSILSLLIQLYLNPADDYFFSPPIDDIKAFTYPWDFKVSVLETLAHALLPAPLDQGVIDALNGVADAIGGAFVGLPDSTAGVLAVSSFVEQNVVGNLLTFAKLGILAPVYAIANTVEWVGYLPAELEATVESAIGNPAQIPGLLSNLVYSVLDPDPEVGLLGAVVYPFANAGFFLPSPVGGLVFDAYQAFTDAVEGALDAVLPTPVVPTPLALAAPETLPVSLAGVESAGLESATAETPNAITFDVPPAPAKADDGLAADAVALEQDSQEEVGEDTSEGAVESPDPEAQGVAEKKSAPPAAAEGDGAQDGPGSDVSGGPGSGKAEGLPKDVKKALDRASVGKSDAAEKSAKARNAKSDNGDSGISSAGSAEKSAKTGPAKAKGGDSGGAAA